MDAVVLGTARRDDDDRRSDPLAPRLLDHLPAVEARQHQIEHADVRMLEAQPREAGLAVGDADCVEAGRLEVARHPLRDDVVVLDDQDLRHSVSIMDGPRSSRGPSSGGTNGNRVVNELLGRGVRVGVSRRRSDRP